MEKVGTVETLVLVEPAALQLGEKLGSTLQSGHSLATEFFVSLALLSYTTASLQRFLSLIP